jgi:feruloyl-CoA synthase
MPDEHGNLVRAAARGHDPAMTRASLKWQPADFSADAEWRADGSLLLTPRAKLSPYPTRFTDALEQWAEASPQQTLVARRNSEGEWQRVSYRDALIRVRRLAAGLSALPLSVERPLLILSGNSIEHMLLSLAAMYVGVPFCPVSPAYSRADSDLGKLRHVVELLTPGMVAAFGVGPFARAIDTVVPESTLILGDCLEIPGRPALTLAALEAADAAAAEPAHAATGADTIAKFLLTSGSTGQPKAVVTTHRMICSNQAMLRHAFPFVLEEPPVLVDWLPWNHTFGGSHNVGLALCNGGTLYIDDGRPTAAGIAHTLRNLREIAPSIYFNVPSGFDMLVRQLPQDAPLRANFFSRLHACFYAGAALSQPTWEALEAQSREACGHRVPILSGLGVTETSPAITFTTPDAAQAGFIGLPGPGNVVKLAPVLGKLELRVQGPHVMPGYWRRPDLNLEAFDDEGFYRLGDAVRLIDAADPLRGLLFDGRIAEDFKLSTGTWVSVGPLRAELLAALAPLAFDVVIAGLNRDFISVLIFPAVGACADFLGLPPHTHPAAVVNAPRLEREIARRLDAHGRAHPASSKRVERAMLLAEPPALDRGEITDKGSINQRAVLQHREQLVTQMYLEGLGPNVIPVRQAGAQIGP